MTEAIVNYLNLKLETVGRLGVIHCLAELRSDGTTTVPYVYSGTGQVVPINIDGGNLSYWRMDSPISFEPIVGKYGVNQMSGTYDLRLVVVARRKDSTVDDAFMPTRLAEDIANLITGNSPDLKLLLKAQSVSIRVNSIDTNIPKIWGEEFTGTQVNDLNYTRAIMALSVSVTVIGSRDCWQNECDIDPNILHIFDFCNPNVVAELTPTQVACLEDALCEPCADVTIDINGVPFDTVPSGGTLDIPVIDTGSNPVGSQSGADYVIANNATYINAVQVTDQTAETDAFIAVELDGSPSGTWNAGTQTWEITSPPCADGNIELNGVQVATVASGGTENIDVYNTTDDDTLVPVDPVGVLSLGKWIIGTAKPKFNGHSMSKIKAEGVKNYSIRLDGVEAGAATNDTTWDITSAACSPVTFQINSVNKESLSSGSTFNLITKLDGAVNSGSYDAPTDTLSFTCPPVPSVSLAVSDTTPDVGQVITLTATPTNITPTGYTFFTYDGITIQLIIQQAGSAYNWTVNRSGSYNVYVMASDGTDSASDFVPIVATQTYLSETIAYMTAVGIADNGSVTVHGITGSALWSAVNNFFVTSKATTNWLTKIKAAHLMIGGTSVTTKWNAVNPLDTDAAFRLTFFGGMTFNSNGITGNAINAYANTFVTPASVLTLNGAGVTIYQKNAVVSSSSADKWFVGTAATGSDIFGLDGYGTEFIYHPINDGFPPISPSITNFQGILTANRTASNANSLLKNGALVVTRTTGSSGRSGNPVALMAINVGSTLSGYVNANIATSIIHDGMTNAEVIEMHTAIASFNTALGR